MLMLLFMVIYFKRDWKEISASLGIYSILCWSSDAPPPLVLQNFKLLASSIVHMSMSSSTRCDAVSVCLLSWTHHWILHGVHWDTHIAEVLAGVTLNVNVFECWHAGGPSLLARFVKDLIWPVPLHRRPMWNAFSACGLLYSGRRRAMFRCLEMSICIKLNSAARNVLPTVTVCQRLCVNVAELM